MLIPNHLSEQLMYNTILIHTDTGTGTGFFFDFGNEEVGSIPVLITNKHVVKGSTYANLLFHLQENGIPLNKNYNLHVNYNDKDWIGHPNQTVDLCFIPIGFMVKKMREEGHEPFYKTISLSNLPTTEQLNELTAMEEITMVGYPNGLWDEIHNFPIFRKGSTATHPNVDYGGKKEFLIDCSSIQGSSGSPVFIYNPSGGYAKKSGGIVMGTRFIFLGILYATYERTILGDIGIKASNSTPVAFSKIPINLGIVIKSERINDLKLEYDKVIGLLS